MTRQLLLLGLVCLVGGTASAQSVDRAHSPGHSPVPHVSYPLEFTVSPPVREMPAQATPGPPKEIPLRRPYGQSASGNVTDPVVQTSATIGATAQALGGWEGLGAGYPGYTVGAVPPDPNIAVGPNHIVQWVNNAFVVFDKQGNQVQAPISDATFWGSTSTCYQLGGFSDPIVQYDRAADRWVIGEVAIPLFPGLIGQFAQCFAVSTTSDPTGSYYLWAYGFGTNINDYPKIGIWPDGYYITWNIFQSSGSFIGPEACAFDRSAMLGGASAPALVCFSLNSGYASLLPSDLDGSRPPPTGAPNSVMSLDLLSSVINVWQFHVDFVDTRNSTFSGPVALATAPFAPPCVDTQDCIPQPGTTMRLDAVGDRLMYRLAYRNFGDHASVVATHTALTLQGNTAARWYEIRDPGGTPVIHQQGTFAPDLDNRWMGSIAMDKAGNIGLGYSVAGSLTYPSIRYTGWEVGNPLGELQAETFAVIGGGSQTGYNRWGDYSTMRTDPSDDCTFWYTQEYQATTQSANWNTRIIPFRFPSCGQSLISTTTALVSSLNPSTSGQTVVFTATVSPSAATGTVQFFDGATLLGTIPVSGGSASLSISSLTPGSHSITAAYSGDSTHGASTSPTVTQVVNGVQVATSTTLTSNRNPSNPGQPVTFKATVSPSAATGTVRFFDGSVVLGTATLTAGSASFTTSSLSIGPHSITAQYGGDGTYQGSTSAVLTQTVRRKK